MSEYDEVRVVYLRQLQPGDVIIENNPDLMGGPLRVRRKRPVELPTEPYTAIHSTWDSSGGIAEFDAFLLPPKVNLLGEQGEGRMWMIDDGSLVHAIALASRISYYDVKAEPVEP